MIKVRENSSNMKVNHNYNYYKASAKSNPVSEILMSIKLIKFYAWEMPFYERIDELRKKELGLLKRNLIANSVNFMMSFGVPVLCILAALLTYRLTGNMINPVIGFTIVSVLNTLRYPLFMTPLALNSLSGNERVFLL